MKEKISSQNLAENRTDTKYSLVYICSPLRPVSPDVSAHPDELKANLRLACDACTFAAVRGFIPVAPHLYFPQFLDDDKPMERTLGMNMGLELLRKCEALWIVSHRISYGMSAEIKEAQKHGILVKVFTEEGFRLYTGDGEVTDNCFNDTVLTA